MTKVMITAIDDQKVEFTSSLGNGAAKWVGVPPRRGDAYHVEIDVDDHFQWGRNITMSMQETPGIAIADRNLLFYGKILSYEDDGILTVKVGDEIIFLEVPDCPVQGEYVSFFTSINNVSLHPVNL